MTQRGVTQSDYPLIGAPGVGRDLLDALPLKELRHHDRLFDGKAYVHPKVSRRAAQRWALMRKATADQGCLAIHFRLKT